MENNKPGRPAQKEVYVVGALVKTSKGPKHHGDTVKLPDDEIARLRKQRLVR